MSKKDYAKIDYYPYEPCEYNGYNAEPNDELDTLDYNLTHAVYEPKLDIYGNNLNAVLTIGLLFLSATAIFGLMPVLGALLLGTMGVLMFGMVGSLLLMGGGGSL